MVIVAKLKAQSGKEAEMEDALKSMIPKVQQEDGTLIYTLHRSLSDPTLFLFYEKYRDKAAFNEHGSTPYFKELFATIGPLMGAEPSMEMYEELAGVQR